jgi:hypothetical protein
MAMVYGHNDDTIFNQIKGKSSCHWEGLDRSFQMIPVFTPIFKSTADLGNSLTPCENFKFQLSLPVLQFHATISPIQLEVHKMYLTTAQLPQDHLLLDSAPNLGPLISRGEINKFEVADHN